MKAGITTSGGTSAALSGRGWWLMLRKSARSFSRVCRSMNARSGWNPRSSASTGGVLSCRYGCTASWFTCCSVGIITKNVRKSASATIT